MPLFNRRYSAGNTRKPNGKNRRFSSFKKALQPKRKPPRFNPNAILEHQCVRVRVDWDDVDYTNGVVERYSHRTDKWRVWMGPEMTLEFKADRITKDLKFNVYKSYRRHQIFNCIKRKFPTWPHILLELIVGYESEMSLEVCLCGLKFREHMKNNPHDITIFENRKLFNDQHGDVHLGKACRNGCLSCLVCILEYDMECINSKNSSQRTGCYIAAMKGHDAFVQTLYQHGADIHIANENNATPLYIAAEYGRTHCIKTLFDYGADLNVQEKNYGVSPTVVATQEGHADAVDMLCKLGANVNLTRKSKASPVYIAAQKGFDEILRTLVKYEANINLTNENGATPIYIYLLSKRTTEFYEHFQNIMVMLTNLNTMVHLRC